VIGMMDCGKMEKKVFEYESGTRQRKILLPVAIFQVK
jgi:hypothetical protein